MFQHPFRGHRWFHPNEFQQDCQVSWWDYLTTSSEDSTTSAGCVDERKYQPWPIAITLFQVKCLNSLTFQYYLNSSWHVTREKGNTGNTVFLVLCIKWHLFVSSTKQADMAQNFEKIVKSKFWKYWYWFWYWKLQFPLILILVFSILYSPNLEIQVAECIK